MTQQSEASAPGGGDVHQFARIGDRLNKGDVRMQNIESELQGLRDEVNKQRAELARNSEITEEIRAILAAGRSGLKVIGVLGAIVKWAGGIAAALVALWGLYHTASHGGPPRP